MTRATLLWRIAHNGYLDASNHNLFGLADDGLELDDGDVFRHFGVSTGNYICAAHNSRFDKCGLRLFRGRRGLF